MPINTAARVSLYGILHTFAVSSVGLATVVMLAEAASAQEVIRCVDDPGTGIPVDCESFAFDIQLTDVTDPFGVFGPVQAGEVLTGTYTVFNDILDVDGTSTGGRYLNGVECATIDLGERVLIVDLTPFEILLPPASSDPGITVLNNVESPAPPFTLVTDSATFGMAGPRILAIPAPPDPTGFVFGGGGVAFGYGNSCIVGIQTPCPPTVLSDDGIPAATGDTTALLSAQMSFQYMTLASEFGAVNSNLLAIDPTPVVACPEPGFEAALMAGVLLIVFRRPRARAQHAG